MEPSDEELGAFNQSECQRLLEDRRQWALQEEVGRAQDLTPAPANEGWGWVGAGGQSRFSNRFCPWLAVWPRASISPSLDLCFLICKMRNLTRRLI